MNERRLTLTGVHQLQTCHESQAPHSWYWVRCCCSLHRSLVAILHGELPFSYFLIILAGYHSILIISSIYFSHALKLPTASCHHPRHSSYQSTPSLCYLFLGNFLAIQLFLHQAFDTHSFSIHLGFSLWGMRWWFLRVSHLHIPCKT